MSPFRWFWSWLASRRLKRRLARALPRSAAKRGRPWLSRGPSTPATVRLLEERHREGDGEDE